MSQGTKALGPRDGSTESRGPRGGPTGSNGVKGWASRVPGGQQGGLMCLLMI